MMPAQPVASRESSFLLSRVIQGAGLLYASTFLQLVGRFIFALLVARWLGADAVGIFTVGFVFTTALSMIATAGVEVGLFRFVSRAAALNDFAAVRGMTRASLITTLSAACGLAVLYVVLVPAYPLSAVGPEAVLALRLFGPALVLQVLVSVLGSLALALGHSNVKVLAERVAGSLTQIGALMLLLAFPTGLTGVVVAYLAGLLAAAALAIYLVRRMLPRQGQAAPLWQSVKTLYAFSYKQGLARIVGYTLMNSNLLLLGYLANPTQVGLYAAASRLALIGLLLMDGLGQLHATLVASQEREALFKEDYQRVTKWLVIASAPLFVLLIAFAPAWMSLMGPEFVVGAPVLVIVAASQLVNISTGSTGLILAVRGRAGLILLNNVAAWGLSAILTLVWAGPYGAVGAAAAYLAAIIVTVTLEAIESGRVFGFYPSSRSMLKPVALVSLLALAALGLAYARAWSFVPAAGWSALLLVAYGIVTWRLVLQPVDIEALKGAIRMWSARRQAVSEG